MEKTGKIAVEQCCVYYQVEASFMWQLEEYGLLELDRSGKGTFIAYEQLPELERFIRLHYELEINIEGMEAIKHLLNRMQRLQQEINRLQNESGV